LSARRPISSQSASVNAVSGETAIDHVVRPFRYQLIEANAPKAAARFRDAVRLTVKSLLRYPLAGPRFQTPVPGLASLPSWPVAALESVQIYHLAATDEFDIIGVLHGKRDGRTILGDALKQ